MELSFLVCNNWIDKCMQGMKRTDKVVTISFGQTAGL